ncbi:MAG: hypothetical protein QOI48_4659 [Solirubrobacteraceae bacterium]|jgi:hypothetical protein|nr:hypothetical protein [Solirubrobacteraceae bacterium]
MWLGVFAATMSAYPLAMDCFELSERWCGWKDVDVIFIAARAAIEAGPFDPPICEVVFDEEFDPFTVDTLQQAREHLRRNRVRSMDIILSQIDEDEARLTLRYSGERLQLNGYGRDWHGARAAYDAAQAKLAAHFGITTFKLPELPRDTVAETRKRLVIEELEAALENVDSSIENDCRRGRGKIVRDGDDERRNDMAARTKADRQAAANKGQATRQRKAAENSGTDAKQSAKASGNAAISTAKSLAETVKQGVKSLATRVGAGRKGR